MLSSLAVPWANGLANLIAFVTAALAIYAYLRLIWPKFLDVFNKLIPHRARNARLRALGELADIRNFDRHPRRLIARIGQQIGLLAIIAGGLFTYRAMATPAAIRALISPVARREVAVDMAVTGILELILGTGLILVAGDVATRLRAWASPRSARLRIIRRYLAGNRSNVSPNR